MSSLSETLREGLRSRMQTCPTCGHPALSTRGAADLAGVPSATLWRFLRGHTVDSDTLDKISAWLEGPNAEDQLGSSRKLDASGVARGGPDASRG